MRVTGLDHVVLNVADPEASARWYADTLGLAIERLEEWRAGSAPFVSVRIDATTIIDMFEAEATGKNVDHVALVVDNDVDLDALADSGTVDVVRAPARLWGARGWGRGLYLRDPDGHVVELRQYD
ncbi:MAG: VOC family protein [Acidimicrobiia bacterium]|nr:VOC family protein [Acidimicrobiia bacterium]